MSRFLRLAAIAAWLLSVPFAVPAAPAAPAGGAITVFAAASLANVLEPLGADYTRRTGTPVRFSFAGTAALARQLAAGARADLFIAADLDWMDHLDARGLVRRSSRQRLAGNELVLIAPADSRLRLRIANGFALRQSLNGGRLALADPASVPAGRYAKQALTALGVWHSVAASVVPAEDVRQALRFVARGEAPLGIVYATDALAEPKVRVVGVFPASSHVPVVYPMALTHNAAPAAAQFLAFLRTPVAQGQLHQAGFRP